MVTDQIRENWQLLLSLGLMALGVWSLLPSSWPRSRAGGIVLAVAGGALLATRLHVAAGPLMENVLFGIFAIGALLCSLLMISSRNPVYAALWFALVTLSVCGLFLLQYAPFLAAATIVVYAGAIVVTFLFVMMLAQQSGATIYDQRARQPLLATIAAFVLFGALLLTLETAVTAAPADAPDRPAVANTNILSKPVEGEELGSMKGLGRSLFGDYLFAVELAGTVLLIATIGAIAMAPRRAEGTL